MDDGSDNAVRCFAKCHSLFTNSASIGNGRHSTSDMGDADWTVRNSHRRRRRSDADGASRSIMRPSSNGKTHQGFPAAAGAQRAVPRNVSASAHGPTIRVTQEKPILLGNGESASHSICLSLSPDGNTEPRRRDVYPHKDNTSRTRASRPRA